MSPSGGMGMGIDRLLMGSGIREAIGVSAGTTTMSGLDAGRFRNPPGIALTYSLSVESSCDGSVHHVPEGGRRAWRRRSP